MKPTSPVSLFIMAIQYIETLFFGCKTQGTKKEDTRRTNGSDSQGRTAKGAVSGCIILRPAP